MKSNIANRGSNMTDEIKRCAKNDSSGVKSPLSDRNIIVKILETSPVGIIVQDAEGMDILANARAEEILGISRREITSRKYDSKEWDVRDLEGKPRKREDLVAEKVRKTGKPVIKEQITVPYWDGERVILSVSAAPILDENGLYSGLIYAFEDITQRVQTEKELAAHKEHLEELIEARTAELEETNSMLEAEIEERKLKEKELQIMSEQLRSLTQRMETAREEEKAHIAVRIHDTFEQSLAILKMQVKRLEKTLSAEETKSVELSGIYSTLNHFLDEIQVVSEELRPRILNDAGLIAAMEWKVNDLSKATDIDISFNSDLGGLVITEILGTFIFRVFQEAIENAVQHAEASRIETDLAIADGDLVLGIADNGRGISQTELSSPESLGLLWMKERAKHFGGSIEISGKRTEGTRVTLRIPVSNV
jgi:PAS domain S-box-containing protein